jgi:hypothetical protein
MRQSAQSRQHGPQMAAVRRQATFDASSVPQLNDFENVRVSSRARPHIPRDADGDLRARLSKVFAHTDLVSC